LVFGDCLLKHGDALNATLRACPKIEIISLRAGFVAAPSAPQL
jgi:hypothetical protein